MINAQLIGAEREETQKEQVSERESNDAID